MYDVLFTPRAMRSLDEKANYIIWNFKDVDLAERWYERLRGEILEALSYFPYKYPIYDIPPWNGYGVRLFYSQNDVVAYLIDEGSARIHVIGVCTAGRDMTSFLADSLSQD